MGMWSDQIWLNTVIVYVYFDTDLQYGIMTSQDPTLNFGRQLLSILQHLFFKLTSAVSPSRKHGCALDTFSQDFKWNP